MRHQILLLLIAFANVLFSQGRFDNVEIKETKLTDNLYMLEGAGGNIGLYVGEQETFMIDDQFAPLSKKIMAKIATLTDNPVSKLVNTHFHGDHSGGNENFANQGAMIFAHDNVLVRMTAKEEKEDADHVNAPIGKLSRKLKSSRNNTLPVGPVGTPVVTFSDQMSLRTLEEPVLMVHVHNAHTDGDVVVYFPESNVIHMGDCFFHKRFPYIDTKSGGSLQGVIRAVEAVKMMIDEDTQIIPGHGPMATYQDLEKYHTFLKTLKSRVAAAIRSGATLETIDHEAIVKGYGDWAWEFIDAKKIVNTVFITTPR